MYQGKSFQKFLQLGVATTSISNMISLPIIHQNEKYISFGAIENERIIYKIVTFDTTGILSERGVEDGAPMYNINRAKVYGVDTLGEIKGTPTESAFDVNLLPTVAGVGLDVNFGNKEGSQALITVMIDNDVIDSVFEGDVTGTTTQQFIFLKKYSGKHKLIFRIEALNKSVRADVLVANVRFLEIDQRKP